MACLVLFFHVYVLDYILERLSGSFRSNRYPLIEKAYAVMLYIVGLSLRDLSERYMIIDASRESIRRWFHRFSKLFSVERRAVAVDETVVKVFGKEAYVWSAVDIDTGEVLAIYSSWNTDWSVAMKSIKMVLKRCKDKPLFVVDREDGIHML